MSDLIKLVNDSEFATLVLQAKLPVLVDFSAEWCGPCKMLAPVLEQVAGEYVNRLIIYKVDVDQNPKSTAQYGVQGIPNLFIFKNGNVVANKSGTLTKTQLVAFLNEHI